MSLLQTKMSLLNFNLSVNLLNRQPIKILSLKHVSRYCKDEYILLVFTKLVISLKDLLSNISNTVLFIKYQSK